MTQSTAQQENTSTNNSLEEKSVPAAPPLRKAPGIETILARIDEISTLPHIALKILEVANDPNTGAADLKGIVAGDVSLSARVLRTVNSSAYGVRTKITNLQQAISYLGFNQIRNLAITASVSQTFHAECKAGTYCRKGLWEHMVSVGLCSRLIATRVRLPNFEDAYLAGLLHDIGIIVIDQQLTEHFLDYISALDPGTPLCDQEDDYLGFNHAELGARLAEHWKFPTTLQNAIRYHHNSEQSDAESQMIVNCVALANCICSIKKRTSVGMNLVRLPKNALKAVNFSKDDIKVLTTDLDEEIKRNESLFVV